MKPHTKIYFDYFGFDVSSFVPCEVCGKQSVSIHHITPQSKFGKKVKGEQDNIANLVALCFSCHDKIHCREGGKELNELLKEVVKKRKKGKN